MDIQTISNTVASIHNALMEISVKGQDVILMASILQTCRQLVTDINNSQEKNENSEE